MGQKKLLQPFQFPQDILHNSMAIYVILSELDGNPTIQNRPGIELSNVLVTYLSPWLKKIELRTGKLIDLYNGVFFRGSELHIVKELFEMGIAQLQSESPTIDVNMGAQINPDGSQIELVSNLVTSEASETLKKVLEQISLAKAENKTLFFSGD